MQKHACCCLFFTFLTVSLSAQAPATDFIWIENNNLRICLRTNGSLYAGKQEGAVQFRHQSLFGEKWTAVVKEAGLWFGGIDPAANLKLSVQKFEPSYASDFQAGLPGVPGSGKFWRVSYDQILQHLADYSGDAVIENPVAEIFAWPGRGNRFFKDYNGFELPDNFHGNWRNFVDRNHNNIYEPDKGEYPVYQQPYGGSVLYFPEQVVAFLFHTEDLIPKLTASAYPVSGMGYAYTFDCPASAVFENSVFFTWVWQNTSIKPLDSNYVACYINADIGNPNDDYHGSEWETYFAYNADSFYDARFEKQLPVLSLRSIQGPLDMYGGSRLAFIMPIGAPTSNPSTSIPQLPIEYYRYMSCHWRDGVPLTSGGNGYGGSEITQYAYRGNPYQPGTWTEVNAKTDRGDRHALVSWYSTGNFLPGAVNQMSYYLTVHPKPESSITNFERFEAIFSDLNRTTSWINGLAFTGVANPICDLWPGPSFDRIVIRTYPNPVSDVLNIQVEGGTPSLIRLYDSYQQIVGEITFSNSWGYLNPIQLPVRHLPPGVYFLEAGSRNSIRTLVQKVVVLH